MTKREPRPSCELDPVNCGASPDPRVVLRASGGRVLARALAPGLGEAVQRHHRPAAQDVQR
jgi:hypothetical protein